MSDNNLVELQEARTHISTLQQWQNIKNKHIYTVVGVGRCSEGGLDVMVAYSDENGELWFRPWKLFLAKFTFVRSISAVDFVGGVMDDSTTA